jgi:hypothetical protein
VPEIPRSNVGAGQQFHPRRDQLAPVLAGPGCFGVSRSTYGPAISWEIILTAAARIMVSC